MSFLDKFKKPTSNEKHGSRYTLRHDKWDLEDWSSILDELRELAVADDQISNFTPTGHEALGDTFMALMKGNPELDNPQNIRPSFLINHAVADAMMQLKEYEELRMYTSTDEIASGLGCVALEPELEIIFDKLKDAQKIAKKIEEQLQSMEQLEGEQESLDEMIAEALEEGDEAKAEDYQQQAAAIQEQLEKLREMIEQGTDNLNQELDTKGPMIKEAMRQGLEKASDDAENMDAMSMAWGQEQGGIKRLPAQKRIELAKRMNNDKFRKMAELIGPMTRLAMAEQSRKIISSRDEIYDLEFGRDLSYVLPIEYLALDDEILELEFYRKFYDGALVQYKLQGTEKVAKGGIIFCEDGSGSMYGNREIWAKAVGLALLQVARMQKRDFYGIHFGGPMEIKTFDFDTVTGTCVTEYGGKQETLDKIDGVLNFAETFFGGGPLRVDQRIATPKGWLPIGEAKVGDEVFGPDGKPTKVIGVYPQGVLTNMYRVRFKDGAEVICDDTHLWTVHDRKDYGDNFKNATMKTVRLQEILETGIRSRDNGFRYSVPISAPLDLPQADLPIEPYLLGYLLGDGTLGDGRGVTISSSEDEHPWITVLPEGVAVVSYSEPTPERAGAYGLVTDRGQPNPIIEALKELGLHGKRGADKFVPEQYLWASTEQRLALLQGLLDSDGNVSRERAEFANTSPYLHEAVVQIVQSLGGTATTYTRKVQGNEQSCWRTNINIDFVPFRLARKKAQWVGRLTANVRSIVAIEPVDPAECVCIKVDREDGLFLTEGMVVTHNTDFMTPLAKAIDKLDEQFRKNGAVKGDIVFATDGQCGVPQSFLDKLAEEKERMGFRVFGIAIGGEPSSEPLNTICDGRVFKIKDMITGGDIRDIFGSI